MLGSNTFGQAYLGQGPGVGTTFILYSVSATVTSTASISSVLLVNGSVSATVTTTASIARLVMRTLSATVTTTATITSTLVEGINIRSGSTKFLDLFRTTNALDGDRTTDEIDSAKTTRLITTDE